MSRTQDRAVNVVDGGLVKPLVVLSIPIVLTNLLMVGYNLADTYWVGRLGGPAVAALSYSWAIIFLVISLAIGFSVAGTVLVAQNKGAGNVDRVGHVAGQTITVVFLVSIVLSAIGYVLSPTLLELIGAPPGSPEFEMAVTYTRIEFIGMALIFGFFIFQSLLQGWGDTRTPFYIMAFGVGLNVAVDPFFILGFQDNPVFGWVGLEGLEVWLYGHTGFDGWGVAGAAVATILTRAAAGAIGFWLLLSGRVGVQVGLADFRPEWDTVKQIVTIGAPASIEVGTKASSVTILTALVALAGSEAVAAYGIGTRITSIVVLPALGLARGVETVVGQNLGANQRKRARHGVYAAAAIIAACLLVFTALVYALAEGIVTLFIVGEAEAAVTAIGAEYLQIVGLSYVFLGVFYIVQGGFRGSGSTRVAMAFAILGFILFRATFAYTLAVPYGYGATGIWLGEALANVAMVIVAGLYFLHGSWEQRVVEEEDMPAGRPRPGTSQVSDAAED